MFWIKEYTDRARLLLTEGSEASLTYAALEVRLALERVCYERLRNAHNYISADDLRTWKPQYVVQTLMEMVDPHIASEWTLLMADPRVDPEKYMEIGKQKGFDTKQINQLWQAMSSFLHSALPKSVHDPIDHYRSAEKMRVKIEEALLELDRLAEGTLIGSLVFKQVSFTCPCGQLNKRSEVALSQDDIVNCVREGCKEQHRVEKVGTEFTFERHQLCVPCHKCKAEAWFPYRNMAEIPKDKIGHFFCGECGEKNIFMWKLMQAKAH